MFKDTLAWHEHERLAGHTAAPGTRVPTLFCGQEASQPSVPGSFPALCASRQGSKSLGEPGSNPTAEPGGMEGCQKAAWVQAEPSRCAPGPLTAWGKACWSVRRSGRAGIVCGHWGWCASGVPVQAVRLPSLCCRQTDGEPSSLKCRGSRLVYASYERSHWRLNES